MRATTLMSALRRSRWKYHQLVITLLVLLLLHPYVEDRDIFLKSLLMAVLLSGIYAASKQTRPLVLACLIGVPTLIAHVGSIVLIHPYVEMAARVGSLLFMALTTTVIFRYILLEPEVTSDVLSGAVCVYLLSGLTWASVYGLIETIQPGSFHAGHSQNSGGAMTYSDFLFFSFATLTTLGYGDITPVTPPRPGHLPSSKPCMACSIVPFSSPVWSDSIAPCHRFLGDRLRWPKQCR